MKMTIESTPEIRHLNGVECQVWQGKSERGAEVIVFIPRIAVHYSQPCDEFEAELQEHGPAKAEIQAFPLRMLI